MITWLSRHTSMRGRLGMTLILLMVVPVVTVVLVYGDSLSVKQRGRTELHRSAADHAARLHVDEARQATAAWLERTLLDLRLGAVRLAGNPDIVVGEAFSELPQGQQPTVVAVRDAWGDWTRPLSEDLQLRLAGWLDGSEARSGYIELPAQASDPDESDRGPSLFQVVIEPGLGGEGLVVVLRDLAVSSGSDLLSGNPLRGPFARSLTLRDQLVATVGDSAAPSEWSDARVDLWGVARGGEEVKSNDLRSPDDLLAAVTLRDPNGDPVGLAITRGQLKRLSTIPGMLEEGDPKKPSGGEATLRSQLYSLAGWIAVAGVFFALMIGLFAPHWVWSDVRDSTDRIFGSVARLRELVRRNGRALNEQAGSVGSLLESVGVLEDSSRSIEKTTRVLAESAEQSARVSQTGNRTAEMAQRAVLDVRDQVADISQLMEQLGQRCHEIGGILEFIGQVGEGTRKLSVNATIKADDPVSAAQQLTFVAGEMRDLAEQALDSTQDIEVRVREIQKSSVATLDATHAGRKEVDRCLESFEELEQAFSRILRWVEDTTRFARNIESSTVAQSSSLVNVSECVDVLQRRTAETEGNFRDIEDAIDELATLGDEMMEHWKVG